MLSGRSLVHLAREVEQGLTLAIYLDLNDSTITGESTKKSLYTEQSQVTKESLYTENHRQVQSCQGELHTEISLTR